MDFDLLSEQSLDSQLEDLQAIFGIKQAVLANILGTTSRTLQRWKHRNTEPHPLYQERIQLLIAIVRQIGDREDVDSVARWATSPNLNLKNKRPLDSLISGKVRTVLQCVEPVRTPTGKENWRTRSPVILCPGKDFREKECKSRLVYSHSKDGWLLECFVRGHYFREPSESVG